MLLIQLSSFNSHEWPRENFSLQYQSNIKQTSGEKKKDISWRIIHWSKTNSPNEHHKNYTGDSKENN